MRRHRKTARALILLVLAGLSTGTASAKPEPPTKPPAAKPTRPAAAKPASRLIFPVVGAVSFRDDFGDPRGQGGHEGNDIMAAKRSLAVAAEAGTVTLWTTSARAGCMLYLHGRSGTKYMYIHLNNDLTKANDNRGGCAAGVAYVKGLRSGAKVSAGQPLGYAGDSGDANGGGSHVHFELHPKGGAAVSPYSYLRRARKLLFAVQPGKPFTAALRGKVVRSLPGSLTLKVDQVQAWPGGLRVPEVQRNVELAVPPTTVLENPLGAFLATARLDSLKPGQGAVAWTEKALSTLAAQLGEPQVLATARVVLAR